MRYLLSVVLAAFTLSPIAATSEETEVTPGLPIWLLYEAKQIADSNRYFDPRHIDIVIPEALWPDAPLSSLEHATPMDFDNDGLTDLLLEQALAWYGPGQSLP
ncbi:MAG: hypothetical protein HOI67_10905, partial [Gammaproteobacteria bacterium]|nr:hypothetical protein [Gammaproteobacteria bacterium]